jgi:DNA-binding IclR family transcriptional regulator
MTANEVSDVTDIPLSTTYRKLDLLTEASILEERTEIRSDGHHTTKYVLAFESVEIGLTDDREFEVSISRPARSADEQLAQLWNEVRKET